MTKTDSRRYYPTALALYITYFVLGIAATIMGQYKQDFAALWGASKLADGSFDVSSVVAVIAAIGLGRLVAFPIAGPLSDRLGRRLSALIGCVLYAIFLLAITFAPNMYIGYVLAVISGMANSFLDTSITPSCMEIFKEKGTIANIFTKLAISIAQFLLPFAIGFVAARNLPFHTVFIAPAVIIIVDGILLYFLPFPPFARQAQGKDALHRARYHPGLPGLHHLHHLHAVDELQPGAGQALRPAGSRYDPVLLLCGHRLRPVRQRRTAQPQGRTG